MNLNKEAPANAKRKNKSGGKGLVYLAVLLGGAAGFGALSILSSAADKAPYYVLSQQVAARTPITPAMLTVVQTSKGSAPPTSYDLAWVQNHQGVAFSKYALSAGDVLTPSNIGPLDRINASIPAGDVVASFGVGPEDAVAGKIRAGDFIEVGATIDAGAGSGSISKIVLHHVLVVDVTVSPSSIPAAANDGQAGAPGAPGPESAAIRAGIPQLYTVALSPQDFTKLNLVKGNKLALALSPRTPGDTVNASTNSGTLTASIPVPDSNPSTGVAPAPITPKK